MARRTSEEKIDRIIEYRKEARTGNALKKEIASALKKLPTKARRWLTSDSKRGGR